jgi:hypothetical protein
MAGETQTSVARRWVGVVVGFALGGLAGWLWGRSIAQGNETGGPIPNLANVVGFWSVAVVTVVLAVVAALLLLFPRRRRLAVALMAAAAGWLSLYAIAFALGKA